MKNIHVISTDKPSRFWMTRLGNLTRCHDIKPIKEALGNNVNIYITNSEEIKEGDWCIDDRNTLNKIINVSDNGYLMFENGNSVKNTKCKKIILTTDQDLIKDGVQSIDDEFLEWFIKNPSCEKVEVEKAPYDGTKSIDKYWGGEYKIIIPRTTQQVIDEDFAGGLDMGQIIPKEESKYTIKKEYVDDQDAYGYDVLVKKEPKQETLEEVEIRLEKADKYSQGFKNKTEENIAFISFLEGAKWQQERSYSEEEVVHLLKALQLYKLVHTERIDIEEWFEKYKNK